MTLAHRAGAAIHTREKPVKKKRGDGAEEGPKLGRGRPKKGEGSPSREPKRLERQRAVSVEQMQEDLPKQ